MKKKKILIISLIVIAILVLITIIYNYYRVLTAKIIVLTKPNTQVEVYSKTHISDLIISMNGKLIDDKLVNTNKVGVHEETFSFINDDKIKVSYTFKVKVVDTTKPIIGVPSTYTIIKGYAKDLSKEFFCGDNYDNEPNCRVEGDYNVNEIGSYNITYKATDKSKNEVSQKLTLNVIDNNNNKTYNEPNKAIVTTDYNEIVEKYKTKNTKIGIDVSKWQGDINFKKLKESKVEFVLVRVGSEDSEGNFFVDSKFEQNIEGFNEVKIPVGIYYYSYANSKEKAKKEAKWVIKQIKKYDIDLPVVFDWEDWSSYREYNMSFHTLTEVAEAFLEEIEKAGYKGMLYSSKYYLENIWYPTDYSIWLAHYTDKTNYEGNYYMWQLCSNGKVEGIDDNLVDIDILYKKSTK